VLRGCCSLTVLRGIISIDCATLTSSSSPVMIMAPSTHSLPTIRAVRSSSPQEAPNWPYTSSKPLEQPIVVILQSVQSGIEGIESISRLAGMPIPSGGMWQQPNRWSSAPNAAKATYKLILEPERDHCATVIPHNWVEALEHVDLQSTEGNATYLVQGPKGVGKSTFSKLLVNTLLSRYVCWNQHMHHLPPLLTLLG
jgi:polynucleotide 5'-hydroxyl-kinase GRC3/NOL9